MTVICNINECIFHHETKNECDKDTIEINVNIDLEPICLDFGIEEEH